MPELAPTACRRCRQQKLRCSRELPICDRCTRLGAVCQFPEPPDRKLIASTRALPRKRKTAEDLEELSPRRSTQSERNQSLSYPETRHEPRLSEVTLSVDESHLTPEVQKLLVDVFFIYVFNNSLLLHRPTFEQALSQGSLPRYTLLAVYAFAVNFLVPDSALSRQHAGILQPLGELSVISRQWAIVAGREVLQTIDTPTLSSIRTCQLLSFYWFANGETQRNTMLSGIALRGARSLLSDPDYMDHCSWLEAEMLRRSFWASWLANCINSDNYAVGTSADVRIFQIPCPMSEVNYIRGIQEPETTIVSTPDASGKDIEPQSFNAEPSIWAEGMGIVWHWTSIRDYLETRRWSANKASLADLLTLDDKLTKWLQRLPPQFAYSKRHLYEQLVVKGQQNFILVHAIWHQCRLVLHSSLVPQFSGLPLPEAVPAEAVKISAHIAMKSARAISELGADLFALDWDPVQVAPFFGYCMYVSASIHMAFTSSLDITVATTAQKHLTSSLRILEIMKPYWKNLDRLWARINILLDAQINSPSSSRPQLSPGSPIDQIANEQRNVGNLPEPLADSVLQYSLRHLHQKVTINTTSTRVDPMLQRSPSSTRPQVDQRSPSTITQSQSIGTPQDIAANQFFLLRDMNEFPNVDWMDPNLAPVFNDASGDAAWWSFDPNNFSGDMLSYVDLIGMDGMA